MKRRPFSRTLQATLTGLLALGILGCAEGVGTISGDVKVKVKEKDKEFEVPLPSGIISFVSQGRKKGVYTADIKDGKYSVTGVPAAKAVIIVQNSAPPVDLIPKDKDAKGKEDKKGKAKGKKEPPIPTANAKYSDPKKSGLDYTVTVGEQSHSFTLDP